MLAAMEVPALARRVVPPEPAVLAAPEVLLIQGDSLVTPVAIW